MDKISSGRCLMLRMRDRRRFFTPTDNMATLVEFSAALGAEVSVVEVNEAEVLDLDTLVPALCDATFVQPQPALCKVIEVKMGRRPGRDEILKNATAIAQHIRTQFLSGKTVSLRGLRRRYARLGLTPACLCLHIGRGRDALTAEGHTFVQVGRGSYKMVG